MVQTIRITEFLRTGNFGKSGEVHFGMSRAELVALLGETKWMNYTGGKSRIPSIYKYDKVEFYFEEGENGGLKGIQILPAIQEAAMNDLRVDYNCLASCLEFQSAIQYLDKAAIKYTLVNSEWDSDGIPRIVSEGKVQLIFTQDSDGKAVLQKVSKFVEMDSKSPKMKQVHFSIPEAEYEQLRQQSIASRKSIKTICREIILAKLRH